VAFARAAPTLGLGLHLDLAEWIYAARGWQPVYEVVDHGDANAVCTEIWRQVERFDHLYGAYPTHLDSHQHVHRTEPIRSAVLEVATELGVVVRDEDRGVNYCGDFHGQTGRGGSLPHAITPDALSLIVSSLAPGTTEVACHPGLDDQSGSVYARERDVEIVALCHPAVRAAIEAGGIALRSFRDLAPERKPPDCETTT
jgi:chitin disaccharide deacetylase